MSTSNDLARMVPGFEFLQSLMKGASSSLPGVQGFGQWIAPTLDPAEIDKRIQELKTVQFWLEQNARLLGTTVQALEVQRMTLSTLQTMNLPLADLATALQARPPAPAPTPAAKSSWAMPVATDEAEDEEDEAEDEDEDDADTAAASAPAVPKKKGASPQPAAAPAAIDPMQWWGALTQQFTEIAAKAVKDGSADAARHLAAAVPAAAATSPGQAAVKAAVKAAAKTTNKPARAPAKAAPPARKVAARKRAG